MAGFAFHDTVLALGSGLNDVRVAIDAKRFSGKLDGLLPDFVQYGAAVVAVLAETGRDHQLPREHENRRTRQEHEGRPDQVLGFFPLAHPRSSLRHATRRGPDWLTVRFVSSFRFSRQEIKRLEVLLNIW
jgi:hypothetical protein